jgi:hypothetical protein
VSAFDEDVNREVLDRMRAGGDDLTTVRPVDFSHVFPDSASAEAFAASVRTLGWRVDVEETHCAEDAPWDATVVIDMAPSLEAVTGAEADLHEIAQRHGGRADGWGCFEIAGEDVQD